MGKTNTRFQKEPVKVRGRFKVAVMLKFNKKPNKKDTLVNQPWDD